MTHLAIEILRKCFKGFASRFWIPLLKILVRCRFWPLFSFSSYLLHYGFLLFCLSCPIVLFCRFPSLAFSLAGSFTVDFHFLIFSFSLLPVYIRSYAFLLFINIFLRCMASHPCSASSSGAPAVVVPSYALLLSFVRSFDQYWAPWCTNIISSIRLVGLLLTFQDTNHVLPRSAAFGPWVRLWGHGGGH